MVESSGQTNLLSFVIPHSTRYSSKWTEKDRAHADLFQSSATKTVAAGFKSGRGHEIKQRGPNKRRSVHRYFPAAAGFAIFFFFFFIAMVCFLLVWWSCGRLEFRLYGRCAVPSPPYRLEPCHSKRAGAMQKCK
jgi:hypothetical protein